LEKIRGRHTELISLYIPAGYNLVDIVNLLNQEYALTQNVKSKTVRKNVLSALTKIMQHLKLFRVTPENGLVIFCGNVSEREGISDIKLWSIEPPEPLAYKIYRCDQRFVLDPLKEMLREREIYGLIVLDAGSAEIGLLRGKKIEKLKHLESVVPSKTVKGGMCVAPNTLVQTSDGRVIPIHELSENDKLLVYDFWSYKPVFTNSFKIFKRKITKAFEVITTEPMTKIIVSPKHKFFVVNSEGIEEKTTRELKIGDKLLFIQSIENDVLVPSILKIMKNANYCGISDMFQLFGYMLGDGTLDGNRVILYDKDVQVIKYYARLVKKTIGVIPKIRKDGNTYELRTYSKKFVDFIETHLKELLLPRKKRDIPDILLSSPSVHLSKFIKGLFDAEGFVTQKTIRIAISNEKIIRKLQLMLLRFGIISSVSGPDRLGRFRLSITHPQHVKEFVKKIGFSSQRKMKRAKASIRKVSASRVQRVPVDGRYLRKLIEDVGLNKQYFNEVSMFLTGRRNISTYVLRKRILSKLENRLKKIGNNEALVRKTKKLIDYLKKIESSRLVISIVKERKEIQTKQVFYDIFVPNFNCFVANGLVIHNSQARYDRLRAEEIMKFLKKVGETASKLFLQEKDLKGVLIGGPGPVKEELPKGEYLHYQIRQKVLGVVDTSYTEEQGLQELVVRGEHLIEQASIVKEKRLLNEFFKHLQRDDGLAVYGIREVEKALNYGAVETLIISDDFDWIRVSYKCPSCGFSLEKNVKPKQKYQKCPKCNMELVIEKEIDLSEYLVEKAKEVGSKVEIVSTETTEGAQFKELGGIGGILRFKI
jgi:peptide subunit release factor 1 (eRF1)